MTIITPPANDPPPGHRLGLDVPEAVRKDVVRVSPSDLESFSAPDIHGHYLAKSINPPGKNCIVGEFPRRCTALSLEV